MSVTALLAELRRRDIQVWPDGDQLRCNAPAGVLTPDLRDELRQHKHDIVQFLQSAETLARQQRAIVPLQHRGNRVPIFGVPGHNGDVFCYRVLAQQLGEDQPFFGLQPPGVDGHSEPLENIEALAADFATQIRAFRTDGPYVIAGFCAGGTIAFELARQLLQEGADIRFVALFSSPDPKAYGALPLLRERIANQVKRVSKHMQALSSRSNTERRQYVTEIVERRNAARRDSAPSDPVLTLRAKVQAATIVGLRRYTPRYFDGRVIMFLPNKEYLRSGNALLFWRGVARETETVCGPDGCQGDLMLLEPHVGAIAELFRSCRPT